MIRGIKFISVPVSNQDVSLKFFTEALGFKVVTDQPYTEKQRWIELSIPGSPTPKSSNPKASNSPRSPKKKNGAPAALSKIPTATSSPSPANSEAALK
jgi:catechol 2,3-dioxygenase-like lactoylglutathione lyase family enzyme